jgi:hypothetical protein
LASHSGLYFDVTKNSDATKVKRKIKKEKGQKFPKMAKKNGLADAKYIHKFCKNLDFTTFIL